METTTQLLLPEMREALLHEPEQVVEAAEELHAADLADLIRELEPELGQKLIQVLPAETVARALEMLDEETRSRLFGELAAADLPEAIEITDAMAADDRADLYAELPEELRRQLLDAIPSEESQDIRQLLAYPAGTAGALMTTEFVALAASITVTEGIERVRAVAAGMETIYSAYAVNEHGTLLGVVSLRDLVTAPASRRIDEVMSPQVVTIDVDADQEEAARLIGKYDLLALPVVDRAHQLLGIITVDDVVDVVHEEATEDIQKFGGMEALDAPYLQIDFARMVRKRAGWLAALFLGEMLTATAMSYFEAEIAAAVVLALFVPLIISSGGNSGSQASTLVVRAMALGEVKLTDWWRVIRRELAAGLALGAVLGTIGFLRIVIWQAFSPLYGPHYLLVAATVAVSLVGVVTFGTLAGSLLPFLLRRLGFDPASASAPFVATLVDVTGLIIYFTAASLFLRGTLL